MRRQLKIEEKITRSSTMKKQVFWNTLGSTVYSFISMLFTIFVTRVLGDTENGIFTIALTTSQVLIAVGYFEVRTFQVSDSRNLYCFQDYLSLRAITCALMLLVSLGYAALHLEQIHVATVMFAMCLVKVLEAFGDVYEAMYQKKERLDLSGKIICFRTLFAAAAFVMVLWTVKSLEAAAAAMVLATGLGVFFLDMFPMRYFETDRRPFKWDRLPSLIKSCFPLFVSSFMSMYIINASRYAIKGTMDYRYQTYYGAVFMPVAAINLMTGFVLKPLLTRQAACWNGKQIPEFICILRRIVLAVVCCLFVALSAAWFLGIPVLEMLYGIELSSYKTELLILTAGGGAFAISTALYYSLTVMRKQRHIFFSYGIVFVETWLLSHWMTVQWGIRGASLSYILSMALLDLFFYIGVRKGIGEHSDEN
ncbi:MAG: lipopolysaccharide biosynthesis protein [Lachnospiraceae bacterium]|nr:lipopolysaccharide biosynthesis protein [Lachnospiraceae bacterium]